MTYSGLRAILAILTMFLVASISGIAGAGEPVAIDRITTPESMGLVINYVEDTTSTLSIFDITNDSESLAWQQGDAETLNKGYTHSTFWIHLPILNTTSREVNRLLEVGYPLLDYVELYSISDGLIVTHFNTGDRHPLSSRAIEHRNFLFPIHLAPNEHRDIYLRVKSGSSLQVPISIASEVEFYTHDQADLIRKSVYYGMMLVMILFNLFLFISLKEKVYFYYIAFVFSFLSVQLFLHGIPAQYLWPDWPYLQDLGILFFVPCIVLFTTLFTRYFLNLQESAPRANLFFMISGWVAMVNLVAGFILDYETSIKFSLATVVVVSSACLYIGPYLWSKGHTIARFYSLAWFSITLAAMVLAFSKLGWIPRTFLTENGLQFGSAMEAILLSMALADRLNSEREQRFKAQEKVITETRQRQLAEEKLVYTALHSPLTGTPNRTYFENWFDKKCRHRKLQKKLILGLIHLRRFHEVNKTLGHVQADELLTLITRDLSQRAQAIPGSLLLDENSEPPHYIAVMEGVTFAILIDPEANRAPFQALEEITAYIAEPIEFKGLMIDVGGQIGTASFPKDAQDGPTLVRNAQIAVDLGGQSNNLMTRYSEAINPYNARRLSLAGELRKAISSGGLSMHFQPKISARENRVTGMEALLRWNHPEHGSIGPDEFIPIAEQTGVIHPLTQWVINHAVGKVAELARAGYEISVAVNISAINLKEKHFPDAVADALKRHDVDSSLLSLEVTETAMMDDPCRALAVLKRLNLLGIRLSIDDFGTGYSSLAYIKQLPVQEIKIDRSFVKDMEANKGDAIIVRTMVNMCHDLGYDVVAEGVETDQSCHSLRAMGCDYLQGYYLSRPLPYDMFLEWISLHTSAASQSSAGQSTSSEPSSG